MCGTDATFKNTREKRDLVYLPQARDGVACLETC